VRNTNGKNNDSGVKEFVWYKIGKNPVMDAESNAAVSLLVIFLLMRKIIITSKDNKMLGIILAANSNGKNKSNNAVK